MKRNYQYEYIFGVDPGKTGAMSVFNCLDGEYFLQDIVDYNPEEIVTYLRRRVAIVPEAEMYAFIENVHAAPGQAVSAMFNFGQNFGWWKGIFDAFGIKYTLVAPQKWSPKMVGITQNKKDKAREIATKTFCEPYHVTTDDTGKPMFRLKKHDGRADSALIGLYGIQYILHEKLQSAY